MMVFNAFYMMVDGVFIARFVDEVAISAVNIFYPAFGFMIAVSLMISTGGNAILSRKLGKGLEQEARENMTFLMCITVLIGTLIGGIGLLFFEPLLHFLGASANEQLLEYTMIYGRLFLVFSPVIMLRMLCLAFFVVAGRPQLGLFTSVGGGILNIVLDYLFIVEWNMGLTGAAIATVIGLSIPACVGIPYFFHSKNKDLYFVKPVVKWRVAQEACINGSSEMVANLASSITAFAYNQLMLIYVGVEGVTAITLFFYIFFLFADGFVGYANGISPLIGYSYGKEDTDYLRKLVKVSLGVISISGISMFLISLLFGPNFVAFMTDAGSEVYDLTVYGMRLASLSFLIMGFNIFSSFLFTSLSNGKISAILAFLRTLGFIILALITLPPMLGVVGIWLAIPIAEVLSLGVSFYFVKRYRKRYEYI
jgi:Na+-driven multidrug efflux pump